MEQKRRTISVVVAVIAEARRFRVGSWGHVSIQSGGGEQLLREKREKGLPQSLILPERFSWTVQDTYEGHYSGGVVLV